MYALMSNMDWKETVTSVSDKVFPGLSHKIDREVKIENQVMSNLPLQMALYFNVIFLPVWTIVIVLSVRDNFHCYDDFHKLIVLTMLALIMGVELFRLYLGYDGNLRDKIPELAGFWMLSLLFQLPFQGALLFNPTFQLGVLEVVVQSVMVVLLTGQLIFGYKALKRTASTQATYFRIMRLTSHIKVKDNVEVEDKYKVQ